MNVLEKMKLTLELQQTVGLRNLERNPLQKLSLAKKVQDLRKQLGLIEGNNIAPLSEYADVVVSNQSGKFLLVQRSLNDKFKPGKWWIPGGHIEQNEEPKEAAKRELKEETGISGSDLAFLEKKSLSNGGISHRFALKAENDNVTLQQKELNDYAWVKVEEVEKYPLVGDAGDLMQLFKLAVPEAAPLESEIQPLQIPENATPQEREKLALNWLKDNVQGKTITAVDGKKIFFNRNLSVDHIANNARKDKSGIVVRCIPFIADVFITGKFVEKQALTKPRKDGKTAFHLYEKWVNIDDFKVLLEAKACEYADGRYEAFGEAIAYNLKAAHLPSNLSPVTDNALGGIEPLFAGDTTSIFDNTQAEYDYILSIKAITDLDGNPIDFGNKEILPVHMPDNQPPKAEMFNYNKEGESTPAKRQAANKKAIELVKMLLDGSLKKEDLTIEQKITLSEYSGNGGNMTDANGNKGSQYEYYTPKEIAGGMWELLKASGFTGGKVLDPCAGTGIFAATAPDGILMDNVELSEVSGTINKAIFENESHKTTISPFEAVAAATPDEQYDAVITNVPFGSNADRGGNQYKDSLYQDESLDHYFILRSLKKLRPNGLAVFMCATKVLTGTKYRKQRLMMSEMAEFIGAYRLPDHVFGSAGAGVVTDVLVFKKHSNETKTRIDDVLKEDKQGIKLLEKANVYWQPFVSGKYYQLHPTNVLGTAAQVKNRYGLVESIQSDVTMAEIAKLMQKLGGSRIDYAMLQAQEGGFITYQDGDTQYFDGVMKTYQNGKWETVELAENSEGIAEQLQRRLSAYGSPLQIIEEKQPLAELLDIVRTVQERQISLQILPDWLRVLMKQAQAA